MIALWIGDLFVQLGRQPMYSGNPWGIYLGWRIKPRPTARFAPLTRRLWSWISYWGVS